MPSIGSRTTLAAPRLARPGETRTATPAPSAEIDQLQRRPADSRAGDDHRRHPFTRTDLTDVIDYSENGEPVHGFET